MVFTWRRELGLAREKQSTTTSDLGQEEEEEEEEEEEDEGQSPAPASRAPAWRYPRAAAEGTGPHTVPHRGVPQGIGSSPKATAVFCPGHDREPCWSRAGARTKIDTAARPRAPRQHGSRERCRHPQPRRTAVVSGGHGQGGCGHPTLWHSPHPPRPNPGCPLSHRVPPAPWRGGGSVPHRAGAGAAIAAGPCQGLRAALVYSLGIARGGRDFPCSAMGHLALRGGAGPYGVGRDPIWVGWGPMGGAGTLRGTARCRDWGV